jgi:hypothetical protein
MAKEACSWWFVITGGNSAVWPSQANTLEGQATLANCFDALRLSYQCIPMKLTCRIIHGGTMGTTAGELLADMALVRSAPLPSVLLPPACN